MSVKRVAIICGGRSSEHPISCISARGVLGAIDRNAYEPVLIGITEEGQWVQLEGADDFVHRNPWEAVGVAAGLGLLIGLFLRRR